MVKNKFLDDNIDVVPSNSEDNTTPQSSQDQQDNIIPTPEPIKDIIQPSVQPIVEPVSDESKQNYMNIIKEYEKNKDVTSKRQNELNKLLDDTYGKNKIPIFKMVRDPMTGEINVEPKNPVKLKLAEEPIQDNINIGTKDCIKEMLDKTNKDFIKATIEVKVYIELYNIETNPDRKKLYKQQLDALKNEVTYQQNRKNILERML